MKLKEFPGGGKTVLPDNGVNDKGERVAKDYKLRTMDFKVVIGKNSGAPFVVVDVQAIEPGDTQGQHTELGFSLSDASLGFAKAWFEAMEVDEDEDIPIDDKDGLELFLKHNCKHKIIRAALVVENRDNYDSNKVSPPWEVMGGELGPNDLVHQESKIEEPPF